MRKKLVSLWLVSLLLTFFQSAVASALQEADFEKNRLANWHQWRGPNGNGATNGNPPTQWDESTNLKWKQELPGEGISTPIVWNGRIYLTYAVQTDRKPDSPTVQDPEARTIPPPVIFEFCVACIDLATGNVNWKKSLTEAAPHEGRHQTSTYAAASPITDGENLLVSFGSYGVFCLDMKGDKRWERDLGDMRTRRGWGEAVSPTIHGDKAIVNWDQEDQSQIFVLDLKTGETVWSDKRDEPTTWATPVVIERKGIAQLITNGTTRIRSYDLNTGEIVWQSAGTTLNAIPTPVVFKDHVICMAGYRGNSAVSLSLDLAGNVDSSAPRWQLSHDTPYVPSPLLSENRLYFTKSNAAVLSCVDADSGKYFYEPIRLPELRGVYASPVSAGGHVYFCGREGATVVIEDNEKFKVVATNRLDDSISASPVVVGNKLLLRGRNTLYCLENASSN